MKKVNLFIIVILIARFVTPSSIHAAGSLELSSTTVGDTTTITAIPNANECSSSLSTFSIAKINISEHDSSNDDMEWIDEKTEHDYPVDLSKAKIKVSINGKSIDGVIQKSEQDFIIWIPGKNSKDPVYPQFLKEDTVVIKITDASISQSGKASFSTTVLLHPTLDSCFGFGMPTLTTERGVTKNSFKPEYTFEFSDKNEVMTQIVPSITGITTVQFPKSSTEKNLSETASQSSSLLDLLSKSILRFVR